MEQNHYLFGYPIAHSLAPTFHNACFEAEGSKARYERYSTSWVTREMLDLIKSDHCGGAAVTMPLKTAILPFLDELSPESQLTGAANTIVKIKDSNSDRVKLVGTNTDILGVRNALLSALHQQQSELTKSPEPDLVGVSAAVIGGGATTRSAIVALQSMGIRNIYIINRDKGELEDIIEWFSARLPSVSIIPLNDPNHVDRVFVGTGVRIPDIIVGVIPAVPPQTVAERLVYATAVHLMTLPRPAIVSPEVPVRTGSSPRVFLEMAYKPLLTPMLQIATALSWTPVNGISATIEQGLAQQRMWKAGSADFTLGSDSGILSAKTERVAQGVLAGLEPVQVDGEEQDRSSCESPIAH